MSEPFHTPDQNIVMENVPTRLKNILNALKSYHEYILQSTTLKSQSPTDIRTAEAILRSKSKDIKNSIDNKSVLSSSDDPQFISTMKTIKLNLYPWSAEISTLAKYWTELMFEVYPFTLHQNHINNLYKNYLFNNQNNEVLYTEMSEGVHS